MSDVVVVGAGVVGAAVAGELAAAGLGVTLLEAGSFEGLHPRGYAGFVRRFHTVPVRAPNSPYPEVVPSPSVVDRQGSAPGPAWEQGYFAQKGPAPFASDYVREGGGSTLHWLGSTPRMLPDDLRMRSAFGVGEDWPLDAAALVPWWERAEAHLGVSGDAETQRAQGYAFHPAYDYAMEAIPMSAVDRFFAEGLGPGRVYPTPQARNGVPRGDRPVPDLYRAGERCQGYASCVPICPIGARYSALRTLTALRERVTMHPYATVTGLTLRDERIAEVHVRSADPAAPGERTLRPRAVVLAANAVENAKLLLASGLARTSGRVGRGLCDHPYLLTWGLAPRSVGAGRGPGSTAGIAGWEDGEFRSRHAAFRIEIGNWGWDHATFSPGADVVAALEAGLRGPALRVHLADRLPRQVRLGFLLDQLPSDTNRVRIDPDVRTPTGELRPVIEYGYDEYVREGARAALAASREIFARCGVDDHTAFHPDEPNFVDLGGETAVLRGAGHLAGTHRMGTTPRDSVVDVDQRTWDHPNLFVVGCGSLPTMGTANPTLTAVALALRTAAVLARELT